MKKIKKYKITFNPENQVEGIELISFVNNPAIQVKGFAFSKQDEKKFEFRIQDEKMIVVAPAMIPDIEIYRKDEDGEYYVVFEKDVIFEMMKKFNSQMKDFKFNYDHKENTAPAYILESWIIEDDIFDKSRYYGFEGLPIGTWMISAQITNKDFWEKEIKQGGKSAFSIEGFMGLAQIEFNQILLFSKIGFDFDETLSTQKGQELAKEYISKNDDIYIITARQSDNSKDVYEIADKLGINHSKIYFTNGKDKYEKVSELNLDKFYDNNSEQIDKINKNTSTEGILFNDLTEDIEMVNGIIDILNQVEDIENRKKIAINIMDDFENDGVIYDRNYFLNSIGLDSLLFQFQESYTDYPQAAIDNAQRALKWVEDYGWGDCGTPVGKIRANQLANREPISRDTIARMAAFERHRQNSTTPYGEGCGKLMWDAWGGDEGIAWAQRKLEQIDRMEMELSPLQKYRLKKKEQKMIVEPEAGESEEEFISRCIKIEVDGGMEQQQAIAVCYAKWQK